MLADVTSNMINPPFPNRPHFPLLHTSISALRTTVTTAVVKNDLQRRALLHLYTPKVVEVHALILSEYETVESYEILPWGYCLKSKENTADGRPKGSCNSRRRPTSYKIPSVSVILEKSQPLPSEVIFLWTTLAEQRCNACTRVNHGASLPNVKRGRNCKDAANYLPQIKWLMRIHWKPLFYMEIKNEGIWG